MTGRELLARMAAFSDDELELPLVAIGVNRSDMEGPTVASSRLFGHPWVPTPRVEVRVLDVECYPTVIRAAE